MATSLAAALRAEQRLPNTSGGGVDGTGGVVVLPDLGLDAAGPEDLRVTRAEVSLPDSPPVVLVALDADSSFLGLLPRLPGVAFFSSLSLWLSFSCFFRSERVRRFSARDSSESEDDEEEEEGDLERRFCILAFFSSFPSCLLPVPVLASPLFRLPVWLFSSAVLLDDLVPPDETDEEGEEERTDS